MKQLLRTYGFRQINGILLAVILLTLYSWRAAFPAMIGSVYALAGIRAFINIAANPFYAPGLATQADANFEQAYAHQWQPSSLDTYRRVAQVFIAQNRLEGAISALEQAYQLWPDDPLVQQELARTYLVAGKMDEAHTVWSKFGTTAEQLIVVGDEYLKQYHYLEALAWYELATVDLLQLPPDLAFRKDALAIMVHSNKEAVLADIEKANRKFPIYQVKEQTTILGAELRLLTTYPEIPIVLYGETLADGFAQTKQVSPLEAGILWRAGEAIAMLQVDAGKYLITVQASHRGPSGVKMAIGIDDKILKVINLDDDVASWETIKTVVTLDKGLHTVNIRFLNEFSVIGGEDRKLEIAKIIINKS